MEKLSLEALARQHLERAQSDPAGRSAETVYGGHEHTLRQTLVALRSGSVMDDFRSPGEGTVLVLRGRVRLTAGSDDDSDTWEGRDADLLTLPASRQEHLTLTAVEESTILLTVAIAE